MIIKHNIESMNAQRMLNITHQTQADSTEKLSSGYKINRSADDAASLSISEKLRRLIRGLTQASYNAQDGISAVQTAEGALNEMHDMLQRLNELAVQAANGTYSAAEREYLQAETDQLVMEIDRVAITTKFNDIYLFRGNGAKDINNRSAFTQQGLLTYYTAADSLNGNISSGRNNIVNNIHQPTGTLVADMASVPQAFAYGLLYSASSTGQEIPQDVMDRSMNTSMSYESVNISSGGNIYSYQIVHSTAPRDATQPYITTEEFKKYISDIHMPDMGAHYLFSDNINDMLTRIKRDNAADIKHIRSYVNDVGTRMVQISTFADVNGDSSFTLHVGADAPEQLAIGLPNLGARALGINGLAMYGQDGSNARASIDTIAKAMEKVSSTRSSLGAVQNRLEHTVRNLDNITENTTAAESRIRDTDMAEEMVRFSNNRILGYSGLAMMAHTTQNKNSVVSLLYYYS